MSQLLVLFSGLAVRKGPKSRPRYDELPRWGLLSAGDNSMWKRKGGHALAFLGPRHGVELEAAPPGALALGTECLGLEHWKELLPYCVWF